METQGDGEGEGLEEVVDVVEAEVVDVEGEGREVEEVGEVGEAEGEGEGEGESVRVGRESGEGTVEEG